VYQLDTASLPCFTHGRMKDVEFSLKTNLITLLLWVLYWWQLC